MAENEILDIKGRRWRETRRCLPTANAIDVADCVAEECEAGLRRDLNKYLREGTSLMLVLKAAQEDAAAMRRAIEPFKNKQIARIIKHVIKECGPPYEANRIAQYASHRLIDLVIDKVIGHAATLQVYGAQSRREALSAALAQRLQDLRPTIATLLEHSLTNTRLRPRQPKPRVQREPMAARTTALLGTSLLTPGPVRHGPRRSN